MNTKEIETGALSLSQQQYLEVISDLIGERGHARMTDVAERMSVRLPSASEAVKRLVETGIAFRNNELEIDLTPEGRRVAGQLAHRHGALRRFMVDVMAMDRKQADDVACRLEHCVDRDFTDRLIDLAGFLEREYPWTLQGIASHVQNKTANRADIRKGAMISEGI